MRHVGVDLHKRTSQVAVLAEDGELTRYRLVNDVERVKRFFAELPPKTPVAIEASGTWWWLVDLLESLGHQPVLSHPKQPKAIASARLKNDRVDADLLVHLLRGDLLPTVWIPPAVLRESRELIRHRVHSPGSAARSGIGWSPCSPAAICSRPRARAGSPRPGTGSSSANRWPRSRAASARTPGRCCASWTAKSVAST